MINLTEKTFPQPTLSLYLGGTGILVGEQFLTLIENLDPRDRELIEPFFIDSQEPRIDDHQRARHYSYTDLDQFYQPVFGQFTKTRFPDNLGVTPVYNSSEGCGVTRIFGAASLAASLDDFANLIEQASGRLKNRRRSSRQPLQVFLTASACGGTGAGMILDAAALVRHFLRAKGESPRIFLFLLGPEVYVDDPHISLRSDQRDRMRASTYALLKELHQFANGERFVSSYRLRDETIDIGNVSDDDRLFEWVYFLNGRAGNGDATRSLDEVVWMIAETQLHLCATEVGRKLAESMPNQREERMREYAQHFIHPDNKERLSDASRAGLDASGRKTFMASFALRNVRFPVEEIKRWFRAGWVVESLRKSLRRDSATNVALVDQFDRLLGCESGTILEEGLLAELGLTREKLTSAVAETGRDLPAAPPASATPDLAIAVTEKLVAAGRTLLDDVQNSSSLTPKAPAGDSGGPRSISSLVAAALREWLRIWRDGLAENGEISERLLRIAWERAGGRGLRFLDDLLSHTAKVLIDLARESQRPPGRMDLEERIASAGEHLALVRSTRDRERRGARFLLRKRVAAFLKEKSFDGENLRKRTKMLVQTATALRHELVEHRRAALSAAIAPSAWLLAAQQLERWREEVLTPTIIAAENALALAQNRYDLAHAALETHQGVGRRGSWRALSTVQLADDELMESLSRRVAKVAVEDLVIVPLQEQGISHGTRRLTIRSLRTFDHSAIVDLLDAHVTEATRPRLAFLDEGLTLKEVKSRLPTIAARILDLGSEPLANFSRSEIGTPLQGYFLAPGNLVLPVPFGRRLGRMQPLVSRDPLQLSVVSFVFGIPPNALDGIRELFEQYAIHVGDATRYRGIRDRYPLHVFRAAMEHFDEPYSPLAFNCGEGFMDEVIEAAQELWQHRGGIRLDIRELDATSVEHREDWNRCVELTEKVLHDLVRNPENAEQLFTGDRFLNLQRLYDSRRHRVASTWRSPRATSVAGLAV